MKQNGSEWFKLTTAFIKELTGREQKLLSVSKSGSLINIRIRQDTTGVDWTTKFSDSVGRHLVQVVSCKQEGEISQLSIKFLPTS